MTSRALTSDSPHSEGQLSTQALAGSTAGWRPPTLPKLRRLSTGPGSGQLPTLPVTMHQVVWDKVLRARAPRLPRP